MLSSVRHALPYVKCDTIPLVLIGGVNERFETYGERDECLDVDRRLPVHESQAATTRLDRRGSVARPSRCRTRFPFACAEPVALPRTRF